MNTKVERRDSLLILISIIALTVAGSGCGTGATKVEKSTGVSIELKKVLSNYPLGKVDTINPLPEIVFTLVFSNASMEDYRLNLQNFMTGKDSNLRVDIKCSNGELVTFPLFQNTGQSSFLKKQSEITLSFKAKSKDILIGFKKCGEGYLGEIIERETENLTIVYESEGLSFRVDCTRQKFESPDYFLME